ncbi:MAG: tetratricopeptide repeat protein [Acidobacteriia bacterium]|nr:tetratricopeptide repeat protein [Terriglobia bacterium]
MCSPFRKLGLLLFLLLTFGLLLTPATFAQNRGFGGKVTNDKGEPVVNAKIIISGVSSKRVYETKTDKKGQWVWMNLQLGLYWIVARADGYDPGVVQKDAAIGLTNVDLKLTPGNPNVKLQFEMTPEEIEKAKQERAKSDQQAKMIGEIKSFFDAGRAAAEGGNYAGAIEQFKKALEKAPEQPTVLANLADAYFKNNQNQESVDAYQKAIAANPTDAALLTNLGVVLGKMGKTAESKDAFQKAANLDPANAAQNFYNLGATLVNSGQPKEAAEAFRQAIKADPNYGEAYYQLGLCLSGDAATMSEAIQMLQQYIKIGKDANNVEVAKQLIQALKK